MFTYDPPGSLDDLENRDSRAGFLAAWHGWIEERVRGEIRNLKNPPADQDGRRDFAVPSPLFFSEIDHPADATDLPVPWNAFPLHVARDFDGRPRDAWQYLDTLGTTTRYTPRGASRVTTKFRRHDEYCEWHWYDEGERGPRLVFTAEGPEYWILLADYDFDRVVELYRKWVSPAVRPEDLLLEHAINFAGWALPAGSYNPFNPWNTDKGVMHLTHPANTLSAEINLAARATVLRRSVAGRRIVNSRQLISSSGYGDANRSSDPAIGFGVNITAVPPGQSTPLSITLANPVGLYMDRAVETSITDGDDQPLAGWFKFVRGVEGRGLMAELQPPEGDTRTLDDVYVGGVKLQSGAQVARLIQMVIYAATARLNVPMSPLHPPFERSCVPQGTDIGNLGRVKLLPGFRGDLTCRVQGAALPQPRQLDDAYPGLFEGPGSPLPLAEEGSAMTRNG